MASRDWLEYAAVMFTCFAAGAASVSAYYASRQADVAQQSADKQLRPYVLIDPQTIITDVQFLAERATTGKVHFKNFGVTPAYRVRLIARLDVVRWPLAKNFSFGKARILFENIVAPPGAQMYTTFTDQDKMTDTEFADVLIGAQRILVYGTLYYSQGDKDYQTNFCASLVPPINGRFSEADTCLVHNEAI